MLASIDSVCDCWSNLQCFVAALAIGNILPVGQIPEGTVICNIEAKVGDCGKLARASSGDYAVIVSQDADKGISRIIRLPSLRRL